MTVRDSADQLEAAINCALTTIFGFVEEIELGIAVQKTEGVPFITNGNYRKPSFELRRMKVEVSQHIKHLGIWFDGKLSFRKHLRQAAQEADRIMGMLSMLLPNVERIIQEKDCLIIWPCR